MISHSTDESPADATSAEDAPVAETSDDTGSEEPVVDAPEATDDVPTTSPKTPPPTPEPEPTGFAALGVAKRLLPTLVESGFDTPTPIQTETIPLLLAGRDVLGLAQTGTGKTAAFALPMLSAIDPRSGAVQALVLTPDARAGDPGRRGHRAPRRRRPRAAASSSSTAARPTARSCTGCAAAARSSSAPPAASPTTSRSARSTSPSVAHFVLDEADEMLQMGFLEEVEAIFELLPGRPSGGAVLGDHARRDPRGLAPAPELAGRGVDQVEDADGHQHPSALRRAARAAEGRRARAHPAGRGLRRRAGLRAHPPEHHRRHRRPQPARVLGGGDLRRPVAAAAREDHQRSALR